MTDEVFVDARLTPKQDGSDSGRDDGGRSGEDVQRGRIAVRVSDQDGSPLSSATITVSTLNHSYEESKSAKSMGMNQTFENVPFGDVEVLIEATGYEDMTVSLDASDFGSDVVRGY